MQRTTTTLVLLALAGSAGTALGQFAPVFTSLGYDEGMVSAVPIGVSPDGKLIPCKAIDEKGVQGDRVEGAAVWTNGQFYHMPTPTDDFGNFQDVVSYQFRHIPGPERGQTIPGIDIIFEKTPSSKAAYWDTRGSDEGVIVELDNSWGVDSWSTNASANGSFIAGALYGDIDGQGVSRHAAKWVNGGTAERMPVPVGTRASEVWWTSDDGNIACGAIGERGMSSEQPKPKPADTTTQKGMIWDIPGDTYRVVEPSSVGAESLVFAQMTPDGSKILTWSWHADDTTKGGLFDVASESYTLLDAGDINQDGQINLFDRHDSAVYATSADAEIIGGSYTLLGGEEAAAIWLADGGIYEMHDLHDYVSNLGMSGEAGWQFGAITGISADGSVLVGWGIDPDGNTGGWRITIPSPASAGLLGLSGLLAARRSRS